MEKRTRSTHRLKAEDIDLVDAWHRDIDRIPTMPQDETRRLCALAQGGDMEARNAVIEGNMRLVESIARRYKGSQLSLPDLISEGAIGLMRAVERYDPSIASFSTHATWWVRQAISRAIADKGRAIRLPAYLAVSLQKVRRVQQQLLQDLGRDPTEQELAGALGMDAAQLRRLRAATITMISLDAPAGLAGDGDEYDSLGEFIADASTSHSIADIILDDEIGAQDIHAVLAEALTLRECAVIVQRFGLDGLSDEEAEHAKFTNGRARALLVVARELGLSRERVRQIEAGALTKLRLYLTRHPERAGQLRALFSEAA